jgi:hypothetical protein
MMCSGKCVAARQSTPLDGPFHSPLDIGPFVFGKQVVFKERSKKPDRLNLSSPPPLPPQ